MKGGAVITIRLNPQDVLGCIDIVDAAGVYVAGMSLSQCVKVALEGLIQAARNHGGIPTRDGFEYNQQVARFSGVSQNRKRSVTEAMEAAGVARAIMDKPQTVATRVRLESNEVEITQLDRKKSRVLTRLVEYGEKKAADPDNWTDADEARMLAFDAAFTSLVDGKDVDIRPLFGGG